MNEEHLRDQGHEDGKMIPAQPLTEFCSRRRPQHAKFSVSRGRCCRAKQAKHKRR